MPRTYEEQRAALGTMVGEYNNPSWVPIEQGAIARAIARATDSSTDTTNQRRINPLTYYSSYTPLISFQVSTPDNYNIMMQEVESMGYKAYDPSKWSIICQSGGVGPNKVTANGKQFFTRDLFIDDFDMHCVVGQNQQNRGNNATEVSWTINEPNGMDLIEDLWDYCQEIGETNYLQLPYLIKISFRGYADDGTNALIDELTKYIPIRLSNMEAKLHNTGAIYKITAIPYNESGHLEAFGRIDADIETWGASVYNFCGFLSWSLNQHQIDYTKRQEDGDVAQQYADVYEIISLPATIDGNNIDISSALFVNPVSVVAKDSSMGQPVSIGSQTKINNVASVIINNLDVNPNSANTTIISRPNTIKGNPNDFSKDFSNNSSTLTQVSVTSNDNTATFSTYAIIDGKFYGKNAIRFNAGSSIVDCINAIIINSNYITDQIIEYNQKVKNIIDVATNIGPNANDNIGVKQLIKELRYTFKWFIITTKTTIFPDKYDHIRRCYAAKYTYCIQPYMIDNAKILSISNGEPLNKIVKEYDYILTGKNTEILNLDLDFKTSFITYAQNNTITKQQGSGAITPAKDQTPDSTSSQTSTTALLVSSSKNPIGNGHLQIPAPSSNKNSGMIGGQSPNKNKAADIASTIYAPAEMLTVTLMINGDPDYIKQDGLFLRPSPNSSLTPYDNNGGILYNCGEIYMNINFLVPKDINQENGLMEEIKKDEKSYKRNIFSGNYRILEVTNKISKGIFTQELQTIRYDDSHDLEILFPTPLTQNQIDENNAIKQAYQQAHATGVGNTKIN